MLWVRCGRRLFALCLTRCGWQGGGWCRACVWCVSLLVLWYLLDICLLICGVLVRLATLCIIQPRWHPFCTVLVRHARRHHRHGWLSLFEATRAFARLILLNQTFHLAPLDALPPTAFNRAVDHAVNAADAAGYARTYIVSPSLIYGAASGPLVKAGLANAHNVATALIVRSALQNGEVGVLGAGASVWANVHIDDGAF